MLLMAVGAMMIGAKNSVSVNPDERYKIIPFFTCLFQVDGRILDTVCGDIIDPDRVSDGLLRWHFRQCVFVNMRGDGEPIWERDFPPGTDMLKEIFKGPLPVEQFELEPSYRLRMSE
ncbi:hypothetical protein N7519_002809 [Penicillium mononematosum]|uniref:uncharacterized protein n=1 Tax=Penicillium mononematosum TaxID=268346 RepID=UPI0025481C04|nr:uncharacterized protein N7519_002809 [Penicillium mononematosum]KAJ6187901.1 hypothetical protein N7519_002809 [Penicillium mononematosum]